MPLAKSYFFLGNTPDLSILELQNIYSGTFEFATKTIASYDQELDLSSLPCLGGTTKVASGLVVVPRSKVISTLVDLISSDSVKNIALTDYAGLDFGRAVFHELKDKVARSIRFVSMETTPHELIMLARQHVLELNLIPCGKLVVIARTVWIYNAEDWASRDRNKPYRDIKRGMLPPKIARIMVNLATRGKRGVTVADPFCGTGTVLSEALMVGCHTFGSDTNPEAITGTKSNLEWLLSTPDLKPCNYNLVIADATHFDEVASGIDCIATEPYMGPLLEQRNPSTLEKIKNIAKGLDKLYRGAFKSFAKTLKPGSRVVMSIPVFHAYDREIGTISIDTLQALGYNYVSAIAYSKPGAVVIRNITILEKK